MDNQPWITGVPLPTSEVVNFDLFMDRADSNQLLTPPESVGSFHGDDGPSSHENDVSVSTTFFPGARVASTASDLIIVPCDSVYFYVHSSILLGASDNKFNSLLPTAAQDLSDYFGQGSILAVSETSSVMNIALHIIYGIPTIQYSPTFDVLCHAVHTLKTYGISPKEYVITSAPIYGTLLSHASEHPLDLFALASQYDLYDLALTTSSHLLNLSLPTLTDEDAVRIGPIYLKRLFFMHLGRAEALKNLLMPPPYPHTPTSVCDYGQQKQLTRAWTLAAASLAWDSRANVSNSTIQSALSPLGDHLLCDVCRTTLKNRIHVLIEQWSMVKRTI